MEALDRMQQPELPAPKQSHQPEEIKGSAL
jgi:hypothetical protein